MNKPLMPMKTSLLNWSRCLCLCIVLAGCAAQSPMPTQQAIDAAVAEALQQHAPDVISPAPREVAPEPRMESERFDVMVADADARSFFRSLVEGTNQNLVVHPDVAGRLTLSLRQVSLIEVLETVRDVYGYDFRVNRASVVIMPATLQSRVFEIDYLNLTRGGQSRTRVSSGQVSMTSNDSNTVAASGESSQAQTSNSVTSTVGSVIDTYSESDFWSDLGATLRQIIGPGEGRQIVVNAQAGVVFARGMPEELRAVEEYLARIHEAAQRQVVLEAKIIEVTLDEGFQSGINWAAVQATSSGDTFTGGTTSGGSNIGRFPPTAGDDITLSPGNAVESLASQSIGAAFTLAFDIGDFNAFVELLETQGETRVLSSPRVATLNNQKAVIKAGSDEFFVTDISSNTVTGTAATTSRDVTLTPFFSGIALDVTPQISANGEVILHIHPTVSEVTDQTKLLTVSGETDELPLAFSQIRESDSIVRAKSGQIIAIGGLMRNSTQRSDYGTPVLGRVPGLKRLFSSTRELESKTELIILLRPIVVDDDADWSRVIQPAATRISEMSPVPR
ncbi:MAG: pilus (MSHA type) biogenesis protein MshL [Gammaproteobacteria bacterium]|jgi:MSHA biogenesis protein MshL